MFHTFLYKIICKMWVIIGPKILFTSVMIICDQEFFFVQVCYVHYLFLKHHIAEVHLYDISFLCGYKPLLHVYTAEVFFFVFILHHPMTFCHNERHSESFIHQVAQYWFRNWNSDWTLTRFQQCSGYLKKHMIKTHFMRSSVIILLVIWTIEIFCNVVAEKALATVN